MFKSVIDFFRETTDKYPEKTACIDEKGVYTYRELWETSDGVAEYLESICAPKTCIPIFMRKSGDTLKILWGVIKAGCSYCIIDPSFPTERIRDILDTLQAEFVITGQGIHRKKLENMNQIKILDCGYLLALRAEKRENNIKRGVYSHTPLYIMFTSGTTGHPKGVVVSHGSVATFIDEFVGKFDIGCDDTLGNQAPWDFDVSVKDIFSAVRTGATLCIIPKKLFSFPEELLYYLEDNKVTVLIWAVSALCIISASETLSKKRFDYISHIIFSGEVMPPSQLRIWHDAYPSAVLVNVYGPTEVTCNCTYHVVSEKDFDRMQIPIGRSFDCSEVILLDAEGKIITNDRKDICGEICVSGGQVALGYYNRPKESEEHFVQNPTNKCWRETIYRTGDLAYYNENRDLVYSGRSDLQIKHLGHRIDLGGIETVIESVDGVGQAVCLYCNNQIIAFHVGECSKETINHALKNYLPSYMIPAKIIHINGFPCNDHGKTDRKSIMNDYLNGVYE